MKLPRRSFLQWLGLAPVAGAVTAVPTVAAASSASTWDPKSASPWDPKLTPDQRALAMLVKSTVERIDVQPGEVLLLKLGDPATGWVPSDEMAQAIVRRFNQALAEAGKSPPMVVYSYAIQVQAITNSKVGGASLVRTLVP